VVLRELSGGTRHGIVAESNPKPNIVKTILIGGSRKTTFGRLGGGILSNGGIRLRPLQDDFEPQVGRDM